jgi:glutathione S-transferase
MTPEYVVHGLELSYFTGKLEAYVRVKGIPHRFVAMDSTDFRRCSRETGIAQMPQIQRPDGSWTTDTTAFITAFEDEQKEPRLRPPAPAAAFLSLLLEDFCDEWLWRPALYYRWAFADDRRLLSAQIARTLLRDIPAPFWLRRHFILMRQRWVFLRSDGVTRITAPQIEALYRETIDALEPIFASRRYLFGDRPCEADFGLFGPFFRHFSHDPTPAAILRARGPHTLAWTARLWATRPHDLVRTEPILEAPEDLAPLLEMAGDDYLPYLHANHAAVRERRGTVRYQVRGVDWSVPASPYRAHCLVVLRAAYQSLGPDDRAAVAARIGRGARILAAQETLPLATPRADGARVANRHGSRGS